MKTVFALLICLLHVSAYAADNIVLVTIDGLRWQEVFRGLDQQLYEHEEFNKRKQALQIYQGDDSQKSLMPFLHNTIAKEGVLFGNRDKSECMKLSNPWYFSYPGYNEILTGKADPEINSNSKIANPNITFLEWLNTDKKYQGHVFAFASWDVFPYIVNTERSGVPVNAGFVKASGKKLSDMELALNELQDDIPSPWETVRHDAFTHHYALEAIKKYKPRVLYISYGETDDFAHDGHYDQYIIAANKTDRFISELWQLLQSIKQYKNNTNIFITVDHGRGESPIESWQHHASKLAMQGYMKALAEYENGIVGSEDVWFAAMGPDIENHIDIKKNECLSTNQLAATIVKTLGKDWNAYNPGAGMPMEIVR